MGLLNDLPIKKTKQWPWNTEVSSDIYDANIEWPKISIVTPSFNQGQFIEETIRSIVLQNYPNLEYIIMDGGSTDNTLEIIDKYRPWIDIVVSEKDGGQSDALLKGFEKSSGKILNWINSDDILCENALFHIGITYINNPKLSFVHGKNGIMDIDSVLYNYMPHPKDLLSIRYLCEMPYGQQACFFTRDVYFESGGINRDVHFSMDYELYLRMHLLGIQVKQIDELIGNIRIHDNTKTAQLESIMHQENGNAFLTYLLSCGKIRYANIFKNIGHTAYANYKVKNKPSSAAIKTAIVLYLEKNVWYYYNLKQKRQSKILILFYFYLVPQSIFQKDLLKIFKDSIK